MQPLLIVMSFLSVVFVLLVSFRTVLWRLLEGTMLHKLAARALYFPSVLRLTLLEGPSRRWYDRVDDTVVLGALPFRKQAKELVEKENVRLVLSYNEGYELRFFTNSTEEWAKWGVEHQWFSTIDFQPPSLPSINSGLALVDQYKKRGESVYIHCKAGKGRSAVVTACYLVKSYQMGVDAAIELLRTKRPQISINTRQRERITDFYNQLKEKKQ